MSVYVAKAPLENLGDYPPGFLLPPGDGGGGGIPGGGSGDPDGGSNPIAPGFVDSENIGYFWGMKQSNTSSYATLKTALDAEKIDKIYTNPKPAFLIEQAPISWVPNFDTDSYDGLGGTSGSELEGLFSNHYSTYFVAQTLIHLDGVKVFSEMYGGFGDTVLRTNPGQIDGTTKNPEKACGSGKHYVLTDTSKRFTTSTPFQNGGKEIENFGTITTTETVAGHPWIPDGEYYTVFVSVGFQYDQPFASGFCPTIGLDYILDDSFNTSTFLENQIEFVGGGNTGTTRWFYVKAYFLKSTHEGKTIRFRWELFFHDSSELLHIHKDSDLYAFGSILEDSDTTYKRKNIARAGLYLKDPANGLPKVSTILNLTLKQLSESTDFDLFYSYGLPFTWGDVLNLTKLASYTDVTPTIDLSGIAPVAGGAHDGDPLLIFIVITSDRDETFVIDAVDDTDAVDNIRIVSDEGTLGALTLNDGDYVTLKIDGKEGYLISDKLTVGHTYRIESLDGGADFTSVGAQVGAEGYTGTADNQLGALFIATGTTPTWGSGAVYNQTTNHYQSYLNKGTLTVGETYRIVSLDGGADFTSVGAQVGAEGYTGTADNQLGALFIAIGTTPTWGSGAVYNQTTNHFQKLEVIDE